jgi:hypothetical protein
MTATRVSVIRRGVLAVAAVCVVGAGATLSAGQQTKGDRAAGDEAIYLRDYAPMDHPGPFDAAGDGYVTVKLTLDRQGNVKDAVALSGPRGLVQPAVENAKKLRLQPMSTRTVVFVYQFVVVDACFGTTYWYDRNLITITGCRRLYSPQ